MKKLILPLFVIILIATFIQGCKKDNNGSANLNHTYGAKSSSNYSIVPTAQLPVGGANLPSSYFLPIPSAFNQGQQQGSCVSCATAMQKSVLDHIKLGTEFSNNGIVYSPAYLFDQCRLDPGNCLIGSSCIDNLNILVQQGVCTISQMPYNQSDCNTQPNSSQVSAASNNKINHYFKLDPINVATIKQFIFAGLPVIIAFTVDDNFDANNHPSGWIWNTFGHNTSEGHCVMIYGWDDSKNALKILNSWGPNWGGDNGSFWVDYNFLDNGTVSLFGGRVFNEAYIIQNGPNNNTTVTVNFSARNINIVPGENVSFSDLSTGNPTSWVWTFQGGTPSTSIQQNPIIQYNNPGIYTVSLTASNGTNSDTKTKTGYITVEGGLAANFSANSTQINSGGIVNFSDASMGNPTSWSWNFPGGTPSVSSLQNPTVVYSSSGQYSVSLTVSNGITSQTKTLSNYITVSSNNSILPAPSLASPSDSSTFNYFPRTLSLFWNGVNGVAYYMVEVDYYNPSINQWEYDYNGSIWQTYSNITANTQQINFAGAQPGRWRVWAVDANGVAGTKSNWFHFAFTV